MADDTAQLFQLNNVSVSRGQQLVLESFSLEADSGEVIILTGENGAGKSTLLETAAGLLSISTGIIHHSGEVIRDRHGRRFRPTPFGLTLQSGGFCQDELVAERVAVAVRAAGFEPDDDWTSKRLDEWGLRHRSGDRIAWLSGGMKRRIGVLAGLTPALLSEEPRLIILDEPSEGLDETSIKLLRDQISGLSANGHCFLIASHDEKLLDLATRNIEVVDGKLVETESESPAAEPIEIHPLPAREKNGFYTGNLFAWCTPLEKRTLASTIPSLTSAFIALLLIEGLRNAIDLPEHRGWVAALALAPGFLAALTPPGLLRFLADSRAGDWWNAMNGGPVQMGNWMFVSVWGAIVSVLAIYLFLGEINEQTLLASLGVGILGFGAARIHALDSRLPRQGATYAKLLLLILIWPFLLLVDFLTRPASTIFDSDVLLQFSQAIAVPLAIFFLLNILASE
jgi:ABC-type multidrug transport system ATPase subunit